MSNTPLQPSIISKPSTSTSSTPFNINQKKRVKRRARRNARVEHSETESSAAPSLHAEREDDDLSEHSFASVAWSDDHELEVSEGEAEQDSRVLHTPPPPPEAGPGSPQKSTLWSDSVDAQFNEKGQGESLPIIDFNNFQGMEGEPLMPRQGQMNGKAKGSAEVGSDMKRNFADAKARKKLRQKEKRMAKKAALKSAKAQDNADASISNVAPSTSDPLPSEPRQSSQRPRQQFKERERAPSPRTRYTQRLESDPSYVPKLGRFWTHDERLLEDDLKGLSSWWRSARGRGNWRGRSGRGGNVEREGRFSEKEEEKEWSHDLFEEHQTTVEREGEGRRGGMRRARGGYQNVGHRDKDREPKPKLSELPFHPSNLKRTMEESGSSRSISLTRSQSQSRRFERQEKFEKHDRPEPAWTVKSAVPFLFNQRDSRVFVVDRPNVSASHNPETEKLGARVMVGRVKLRPSKAGETEMGWKFKMAVKTGEDQGEHQEERQKTPQQSSFIAVDVGAGEKGWEKLKERNDTDLAKASFIKPAVVEEDHVEPVASTSKPKLTASPQIKPYRIESDSSIIRAVPLTTFTSIPSPPQPTFAEQIVSIPATPTYQPPILPPPPTMSPVYPIYASPQYPQIPSSPPAGYFTPTPPYVPPAPQMHQMPPYGFGQGHGAYDPYLMNGGQPIYSPPVQQVPTYVYNNFYNPTPAMNVPPYYAPEYDLPYAQSPQAPLFFTPARTLDKKVEIRKPPTDYDKEKKGRHVQVLTHGHVRHRAVVVDVRKEDLEDEGYQGSSYTHGNSAD